MYKHLRQINQQINTMLLCHLCRERIIGALCQLVNRSVLDLRIQLHVLSFRQ